VSNVPAALNNVRQFTAEVIAMLTQRQHTILQTAEVA
jgi:hypothetical protein